MSNIIIRHAEEADYNAVWNIFSTVIQIADTYFFSPTTPKEELHKHWFASYMDTFVAVQNNQILGTYILKPNQLDLGSHIANCSYMVHPEHQGKGIGNLLCQHSISFAKEKKYYGIQFNIVVSTNTAAIALWKKYGFEIIGTTPNDFQHKNRGLVDTYIMFKKLETT